MPVHMHGHFFMRWIFLFFVCLPVRAGCLDGPLAPALPRDYQQLRAIGALKGEQIRLLREEQGVREYRNALQFDGLELAVFAEGFPAHRYRLDWLEVSSARWRLLAPFHIGQRRHEVHKLVRKLGLPGEDARLLDTGVARIAFTFRGERLVSLRYACAE